MAPNKIPGKPNLKQQKAPNAEPNEPAAEALSAPPLAAFKVADKHRPRVESGSHLRAASLANPVARSMGFARIEALLDFESPLEVGQRMAEMLDALSAYEASATTPKLKTAAKKGRIAIERTIDLLDYLFRTKEAMQQAAVQR